MKTEDFERVMLEHLSIEEVKLHHGQVSWCVAKNMKDYPEPYLVAFDKDGRCFVIDSHEYEFNDCMVFEGRYPEYDLQFN